MNVGNLLKVLNENKNCLLKIMLPCGKFIPDHFHITEIGLVNKTFIDCGGTVRNAICCLLQAWTACDFEHRITSDKLSKIFSIALSSNIVFDSFAVEIEYGEEVVSQYIVDDIKKTSEDLVILLKNKKTDCLAPDKCGIDVCCGSGCC